MLGGCLKFKTIDCCRMQKEWAEGGSHTEADWGSRSGSSCRLWVSTVARSSPGIQAVAREPSVIHYGKLEEIPMLGVWMNSDVFCHSNINSSMLMRTNYVLVTVLRPLIDCVT